MKTNTNTYLITGAAGFIASHLCKDLLVSRDTTSVIGIDNFNGYYSRKIKERRIHRLSANKRFKFYESSILQKEKVRSIMSTQKPTVLIHAAAEVGIRNGESNPISYYSTNVLGTLTVLEEATPWIKHALIFSSSSVYGSIQRLPFRESALIVPSTPLSVYGASKLAMETAVRNYYKRTGIPITIVRPFSIYGPDGRPDMLPMRLLRCAQKNTPVELFAPTASSRDWTYIDDCTQMLRGVLKKSNGLQFVNIGNGHPIRLDETIQISQKITQQHGHTILFTTKPANPIEMRKTWADTSILKTMADLSQLTNYKEGFTKTADFFFSHLDLYDL